MAEATGEKKLQAVSKGPIDPQVKKQTETERASKLGEPMSRSDVLRYLLPGVLSILIAVGAGAITIKADIGVLNDHVTALEYEARGHVSREVLELQLQTLRLELRLIEQKIDNHCSATVAIPK